MKCILCNSKSVKVLDWNFQQAKLAYSIQFSGSVPPERCFHPYVMMRCSKCSLVYADPMIPADEAFYDWAAESRNYYQSARWEWKAIRSAIESFHASTLLEVGCGTGHFLSYISNKLPLRVMGIDTHLPSVQACWESGLWVQCCNLETFHHSDPDRKYDIICAFHCLEHVADPKSTIRLMAQMLKPGGHIIVSVPYSPTADEAVDLHPLNLPPHHLTRWNAQSLSELARISGLQMSLQSDPGIFTDSMLRSFYWLFIHYIFPCGLSHSSALINALLRPIVLLRCARFVLGRDRVNGKPAGNIALAVFSL